MKGVILDRGFESFTHVDELIAPFKEKFEQYNWLITAYDCYCEPFYTLLPKQHNGEEYIWISGKEFLNIATGQKIQFVWGVFSGIPRNISLNEVLKYEFPYADMNPDFWKNPITIQHPLAEIEIVAFDSSFALIISKNANIIDKTLVAFPHGKDLEDYNQKQLV